MNFFAKKEREKRERKKRTCRKKCEKEEKKVGNERYVKQKAT